MMLIHGRESIDAELSEESFFVKGLLNDTEMALFSAQRGAREIQHRETKVGNLSYEDNYRGNALALVIKPGTIEIRYHDRYSDERVKRIVEEVKSLPELDFAKDFRVTYQGRVIDPGGQG